MRRLPAQLVAVIGLTAMVAIACASDDSDEEAYIADLRVAIARLAEATDRQVDALQGVYPVRSELFEALEAADFPGTFRRVLPELEALEPPDSYRKDHEGWLAGVRDTVGLLDEFDRGLRERDLGVIYLNFGDAQVRLANTQSASRPEFCNAVLRYGPPICDTPESSVAGDYGEDVRPIFKEFLATFGPLSASFPAALSGEERVANVTVQEPRIMAALETALSRIRALTPPEEFAADHEALIAYFEGTLTIAVAIADAAIVGDYGLVRQEVDRTDGPLIVAIDTLSPEIKPLFRGFFGN